jgi:hypothetical protein
MRRNPATSPVISYHPRLPRPLGTRELQQLGFLRRLRKLFPTSSRSSAVPPTQDGQPRGPLHVCLFNLFFSSSPSSLLQETVPRSQPQLEHVGLPRGFFDDVGRQCYQFTLPLTDIQSETTYLPRRTANAGLQQAQPEETRLRRFLYQHLSFRRSIPSNDPQVIEVAAGRKFAVK